MSHDLGISRRRHDGLRRPTLADETAKAPEAEREARLALGQGARRARVIRAKKPCR
jgi:hypothetical protein